jgi:hypothetical protein
VIILKWPMAAGRSFGAALLAAAQSLKINATLGPGSVSLE